ncbi:phosphotransferase family protein [Actinocorallia sp. A-T 12471]|uniref:phosphotransferase family protein n=1 Tax=Actinocorallia sp. A-T 12471 TaxID=3089813 RepID=UPI0029D381E1|nr:phosphotransferase [Actinocorallia sp. A-T 12471]MDX6742234.1 phosphotransferase [Actinocorallia sp. A-T 12471]
MTAQFLVTASGLGLAVKEAIRAGLDRATPGGAVPLHVGGITERWLSDALGLAPGTITAVRVVDEHSGTAARVRLAVESEGEELPDHLFLKLPPRDYLQHVLMNLFDLGIREIHAYRALGEAPPVRVPRCHAAKADKAGRRSVLVLEDLTETATFRTVVDSVSREEAEAVIDAFAGLHAAYWGTDRFKTDLAPLAQRSPGALRLGDMIRRRFLENIDGHAADLVPETMKLQCRVFYRRSADIDAFWAARPQTLLHGDPHLGNLFFEGRAPGFLDWQVAMAGPGIRDVAYFATSSVEPDLLRKIERSLVERYAARLSALGVAVNADEQWTLYRAAVTEAYLAAVCTAEAGERMQPREVSRTGVARAVAAVAAHDSFTLLTSLIDSEHP